MAKTNNKDNKTYVSFLLDIYYMIRSDIFGQAVMLSGTRMTGLAEMFKVSVTGREIFLDS